MAVEGSLDLFQLPEILQIVAQEGKTGILTVQGSDDIVAISFLDGKVVAADALNQTLDEAMGKMLRQQRRVSSQQWEAAAAEQRRAGGRAMDHLVEKGFIERAELLEALREQTFHLLGELLHWKEGEFKFYSGDEVSYEDGFRPIAVQDLLLATLPEEVGEPPEEPEEVAEAAPPAPEPASSPTEVPDLADSPLRPVPETAGPLAVEGRGRAASEPAAPAPARRPESEREVGKAKAERVPAKELPADPARGRRVLARVLGLAAGVVLVVTLITSPPAFLFPTPTGADLRLAFQDSRWSARYAKLDGALRTYALIEGRLPEQLDPLVQAGLLSPGEIRGPLGQPLVYQPEDLSYRLRPLASEEEVGFAGSLEGDLLLDPNLSLEEEDGVRQPLVLLD